MFFTVYRIRNKINNKRYIGCHVTDVLNDRYMGSGIAIKNAIKKHGLDNFEKQILAIYQNKEDMFVKEIELIETMQPEYNLHPGGKGGWDYVNETRPSLKGRKVSVITREKMRIARLRYVAENPDSMKIPAQKISTTRKVKGLGWELGRKKGPMSDETKEKLREVYRIRRQKKYVQSKLSMV